MSAFGGDTDILSHQLNVAFDPTRTSSMRGYVFRFAPESGHRALQSACPFRANYGSQSLSPEIEARIRLMTVAT